MMMKPATRSHADARAAQAAAAATARRRERIAEVLKAVAHPVRLGIVEILCEGDEHVNALAERLGVAQPIASQALRILRMRGLVAVTRRGGLSTYRLAEESLRTLVACMERCSAGAGVP